MGTVPEPSGTRAVAASTGGVDALLLLTFGGPDGPDDVLPFLRNVTRGRGVPEERIARVAEHYHRIGGRSPINDQSRALLAALRAELAPLPVYWGNRNWAPYVADTLAAMRADGVRRAAVFVPSVFATYSACRQYREDLADGLVALPADGLELLKLRVFYDHPGYLAPMADRVVAAIEALGDAERDDAHLVFVAHSVPARQATQSGPDGGAYPAQLTATSREIARRVADRRGREHAHSVAYCSRSGPPQVPWLTPDVGDHLAELAGGGVRTAVLVPVGFVSDHMEVIQDLDRDALARAATAGITAVRAATVGTDPRFVRMVAELLAERLAGRDPGSGAAAVGLAPFPLVCPTDCCAPAARGARRPAAGGTPADAAGLGGTRRPPDDRVTGPPPGA
jgi:ferrochelatase